METRLRSAKGATVDPEVYPARPRLSSMLKELIVDGGEHGANVVVKDNLGTLKKT
jgi:hypothetical protein